MCGLHWIPQVKRANYKGKEYHGNDTDYYYKNAIAEIDSSKYEIFIE